MNKTIIKYVAITLALVLVAIGIRGCLNAITHKMITDETISTTDETTEIEYIQKEANEHTIHAIIYSLLTEVDAFEKYPLTQKFKNKFKDKFGIISEIDNVKMIGGGMSSGKDSNKEIPHINAHWKEGYRTDGCVETKYYFDYIVDENEQLDDLILLRKVDYGIDGKRIDGKKEVDVFNMGAQLYALIHPDDSNIVTEFRKLPLAEDCEIINKPVFSESKFPIDSLDYNDVENSCIYLKFIYYDEIKLWKVSYNINEDYQFSYLEFTNVNENDLPNKAKVLFDTMKS